MKKLLIGSAAIALGLALSVPAQAADGVKLELGGHFKGYVTWADQDENVNQDADAANDDARSFDILRETEIHFTGETTLDNGLTVGFHTETDIDNNDISGSGRDEFDTEESYAYFSGAWGRVNFGKEDGAAYLLQVAAPSGDANLDGLRQYVQPVNYAVGSPTSVGELAAAGTDDVFNFATAFTAGDFFDLDDNDAITANEIVVGASGAASLNTLVGANLTVFDYDNAQATFDNKITYLTPVFSGFQFGASYTPEVGGASRGLNGVNTDDVQNDFGSAWEFAGRYEGQFENVGITFGGGYSHVDLEDEVPVALGAAAATGGVVAFVDADADGVLDAGESTITREDIDAWNIGLDLDWGAFGIGAAYLDEEAGFGDDAFAAEAWTVGIDYTTGPFKLGASYYSQERDIFSVDEMETTRWTGGVIYTYGPGMTFRGNVSYVENEIPTFGGPTANVRDQEATSVMLGTQINF